MPRTADTEPRRAAPDGGSTSPPWHGPTARPVGPTGGGEHDGNADGAGQRFRRRDGGQRAARMRVLFGVGAGVGLACAMWNLVRAPGPGRDLPADAAALINGEPVRRDAYERALAALATDRRAALDAEGRRHVLDRLIDEELLVQRAVALGLVRHDRRVRSELVSSIMAAVLADGIDDAPTRAAVGTYYRQHRDYFTRPGRVHVERITILGAGPPSRARADQARDRLRAGEALALVRGAIGADEDAPLPDGPLPVVKLREYLGPTAMRAALGLAPGAVSEPLAVSDGWQILRLVARDPDVVPPLAEIEDEVRAEMRRRAGDTALRDYLDGLRARAELRIAPELR